jgi:hypothetical protein
MEQGEKLSRVLLHLTKTPNSEIKFWEGNIWWNLDVNVEESTEGEILMLRLGGLHVKNSSSK